MSKSEPHIEGVLYNGGSNGRTEPPPVDPRPAALESDAFPELTAAQRLVLDVHERLFKTQLEHYERVNAMAARVAQTNLQLLDVMGQTIAVVLGKMVEDKKTAPEDILEFLKDARKIWREGEAAK